jgi:hypothetical protein
MAPKPLRTCCAALAALVAVFAARASGQQRILFPTQLSQPGPIDPGAPAIAGPVPSPAAPPAWDPYADQGLAAPAPTYPPAGTAPYGAPPVYGAPGPYAQPYAAPGPYYTPPPTTPGYLYPDGGPTYAGPGWPLGNPLNTIGGWTRFFQELRLEETYMFDSGPRRVAFNDIQTSATFAIPPGWSTNPILLTPGFGIWLWDGPPTPTANGADLPGQTYDAYLDTAWDPQFSTWFSAELGVRVGVYSDFHTFNTHSIRVMGRGLGVINYSPALQFKLGVIYIDRLRYKLLPAGGVIWTPDPDTRWEFFFPRPKYTHRLTTTGLYQWWWYTTAEYGGGSWTIRRASGSEDQFDYDDIETSVGIEWVPEGSPTALRGYLEVGGAFARDLYYRNLPPKVLELQNTAFVRGGISF